MMRSVVINIMIKSMVKGMEARGGGRNWSGHFRLNGTESGGESARWGCSRDRQRFVRRLRSRRGSTADRNGVEDGSHS